MSTTSPSGYTYNQGATNVNPFWEESDNPVSYIKSIELVDDLSADGRYIVRYTDQDGAAHTLGYINGFITNLRAEQSGNTVTLYCTKNGEEEVVASFEVGGGGSGGVTEQEVRDIVVSYGYQTAVQVRAIVEGYEYQTATQVQNAINTAIYGAMQESY